MRVAARVEYNRAGRSVTHDVELEVTGSPISWAIVGLLLIVAAALVSYLVDVLT